MTNAHKLINMEKNSKIFVSGHNGLVGSNLVKELNNQGYDNIITIERKNHGDLLNKDDVDQFFCQQKPEYVFNCAAKVGGIKANDTQSGEYIRDNLIMQTNLIELSRLHGVKKFMFLGSSCIYPRESQQPIYEDYLMTGPLEQTNIGYAIAKIAGLTMCQMYRKQWGLDYISVMPTNLYGPRDNFHLTNSHVLPGLMRRFHEAKIAGKPEIEVWGSGRPYREFLYIEDLAKGLVFVMNNYSDPKPINIGTGKDIRIREIVQKVQLVVGYEGNVIWNTDYPDGTTRKLLNVDKINDLGWKAETSLETGLIKTYKWFVDNYETARK